MRQDNHRFLVLLAVSLLVACGARDIDSAEGPTAATSAAIAAPSLTPIPTDNEGNPQFDGDTVDLLFADALAACAWTQDPSGGNNHAPMGEKQFYSMSRHAAAIVDKMIGTQCTPDVDWTLALFPRWRQIRATRACNRDPSSGAEASKTITVQPNAEVVIVPGTPLYDGVRPAIDGTAMDLASAGLYLCISQQLRGEAPGASSGELLLLPEEQQRKLLALTEQYAKASALQYALLGVVFSGTRQIDSSLPYIYPSLWRDQRIPALRWWVTQQSEEHLGRMAEDFAAAIQLHTQVSLELAQLLARSASSMTPAGGQPTSVADEMWGPASFRQRFMAALYGGDPLASDETTPWNHIPGVDEPGLEHGRAAWPTLNEVPYQRADIASPQTQSFLRMLLNLETIELLVRVDDPAGEWAGTCGEVDAEASAVRLYRTIEASLRTADCFGSDPSVCETIAMDDVEPDMDSAYGDFLLWTKHRVAPSHARQALAYVADALEYVSLCENGRIARECGTSLFSGTVDVVGALTYDADPLPDQPSNVRMIRLTGGDAGQNVALAQRALVQRATAFTSRARFRMPDPDAVYPLSSAHSQGFIELKDSITPGFDKNEEAKRILGSVSALAAVREARVSSLAKFNRARGSTSYLARPPEKLRAYFNLHDETMGTIDGAIGTRSYAVRPEVAGTSSGGVALNGRRWRVDVTTKCDDSWFGGARTRLVALSGSPWAANMLRSPLTTIQDRSIEWYLNQSPEVSSEGVWSLPWSPPPCDASGHRRWSYTVGLPNGEIDDNWVFALQRQASSLEDAFLLLGGDMEVRPGGDVRLISRIGHYLADGGRLGAMAERVMQGLSYNPTVPAYDGFGLPTDWVPPTDPAFFGGQEGASAVPHYLSRARVAAEEATGAIKSAIEASIEQQSDLAARTAAEKLSTKVIGDEVRTLCGDAVATGCDAGYRRGIVNPEALWPAGYSAPTCPPDPNQTNAVLDCIGYMMVNGMALDIAIANEVNERVWEPAQPGFHEYAGGSLQQIFIQQWAVIRRLLTEVQILVSHVGAAKAHVATAEAEVTYANALADQNCSAEAMRKALLAGTSTSATASVGFPKGGSVSVTASFSPGPWLAQKAKCDDLKLALGPAEAALHEAMMDSLFTLVQHLVVLDDIGREFQVAGAQLVSTAEQTRMAVERAQLEAALSANQMTTSFGLYRAYQNYDLWRARALLESSRMNAVAARRAIEARYVVNLSSMHAQEPFVAAPSSWADEIYRYDLDMPAAVGLSIGSEGSDGIYASQVLDYVGNLERFVDGYGVGRPSASTHEDVEVLSLPGLEVVDGPLLDDAPPSQPKDARSRDWSFYCDDCESWVELPASGKAADACSSACESSNPPSKARIGFSLDPWGRKGWDIAHEPYQNRFNARWTRLAVNLAGTGLIDCSMASDPLTCYSEPFLRYQLTHVGPAWVSDFEQEWHVLGLPRGQIEGAKALATEMWLDPISESFSKPEVDAVARSEFRERPCGGVYHLELDTGPEVRFDRLERVQVLAGGNYWVKQQ